MILKEHVREIDVKRGLVPSFVLLLCIGSISMPALAGSSVDLQVKCGTKITSLGRDGQDQSGTIIARTVDSLIVRTNDGYIMAFDSSQVATFYPSELKSLKTMLRVAGVCAVIGAVGGLVAVAFDDSYTVVEGMAIGIGAGFMGGFMIALMGDPRPLRFEDVEVCDSRQSRLRPTPGLLFSWSF